MMDVIKATVIFGSGLIVGALGAVFFLGAIIHSGTDSGLPPENAPCGLVLAPDDCYRRPDGTCYCGR